jgi:hypothetical protein
VGSSVVGDDAAEAYLKTALADAPVAEAGEAKAAQHLSTVAAGKPKSQMVPSFC